MLKFLRNIASRAISFKVKNLLPRFSINIAAMANDGLKNKSDLNLDEVPVKKMRLDTEKDSVLTRTVATMCGAWRPEEEYGGLVFVFKTRDPGLSPNPTNEADYPENIEDFWEATFPSSDDEQVNNATP